jgi:hypothetical protein
MGSESSMAFALSDLSRGLVGPRMRGEISACKREKYARAIVAMRSGEMEGRTRRAIPCIDRSSCLCEYTADLNASVSCSHMEGRDLLNSPCLDRCSCCYQYAADFDVPPVCSEM